MPAMIVFTLTARIKLEQRLASRLAECPDLLEIQMSTIRETLQQVFPNATVAIVQDVYSGFRIRPGEQILLVEIANSGDRDGLSVVKLGPSDRLKHEWDAWQQCRPHGLRHDIVLMDLQRVPDTGETITALVYADAQQLLGVDETVTLERAMLDAVRLGVPTVESVADAVFQLYERLGLLLYRHSADTLADPHCLDHHLLDNLAVWDRADGPAYLNRVRATTETQEAPLNAQFRDPAQLFQHIIQHPTQCVPRMLRGRSHGDLHGRNVLVGRVGDRVLWPAVYDYGNMSRLNWIGWDFVKLEMEFKIRAYPLLMPFHFTQHLVAFEVKLFEETETCRRTGQWPHRPASESPLDRLHWLLLQLRRFAEAHLSQQGRHGFWLMEYYFQLSLYGLNAGRFENLTPTEQLGAYLSSGCAAVRFAPLP